MIFLFENGASHTFTQLYLLRTFDAIPTGTFQTESCGKENEDEWFNIKIDGIESQ